MVTVNHVSIFTGTKVHLNVIETVKGGWFRRSDEPLRNTGSAVASSQSGLIKCAGVGGGFRRKGARFQYDNDRFYSHWLNLAKYAVPGRVREPTDKVANSL